MKAEVAVLDSLSLIVFISLCGRKTALEQEKEEETT